MSRPTTELAHLFRELKAPAAAAALGKLADRARQEEWSYEQFLASVLKTETDSRESHDGQAASRPRGPRPARRSQEFDFAFQATLPRNTVLHLGQPDFLAGKENVVLLGSPGTRKNPDFNRLCSFVLAPGHGVGSGEPAAAERSP